MRSFVSSLCDRARTSARMLVATGRRTPSGVFVRMTPLAVQALTSTLSYPTPMRAMILTRWLGPATTASGTFGFSTHKASYVEPCAAVNSLTLSGRNSHCSFAASKICSALLSKMELPSARSVSRVIPTLNSPDAAAIFFNHEGHEETKITDKTSLRGLRDLRGYGLRG